VLHPGAGDDHETKQRERQEVGERLGQTSAANLQRRDEAPQAGQ
jgi:hypothetical protein